MHPPPQTLNPEPPAWPCCVRAAEVSQVFCSYTQAFLRGYLGDTWFWTVGKNCAALGPWSGFKKKKNLFRLCWFFFAVLSFSLVAGSKGYSNCWCAGFSLQWLLLLWSMGSVVVAHRLSCLMALESSRCPMSSALYGRRILN